MTPTRPYFLRALYEWVLDNQMTPYLAVDATKPDVVVPSQYVIDGKIILNLAPEAVKDLLISNDAVDFSARFAGQANNISIPMEAILGIYAKETGQGMVFQEDEYQAESVTPPDDTPEPPRPATKRPSLKVVK